jgi:hypothetical protein
VYYLVTECDELNLGLFKMLAKYQDAVNACSTKDFELN